MIIISLLPVIVGSATKDAEPTYRISMVSELILIKIVLKVH